MLRAKAIGVLVTAVTCLVGQSQGQTYEQEPINYSATPANDPVANLQKRIDAGEIELTYDDHRGYLPSVLRALDIPDWSQMLVFSKTSFQQKRILPRRPRAIYFNDRVYVGWVQKGDVIELSSVDPKQGAMFYSLPQQATAKPRFMRHTHECLQCHASSLTGGIPGHIVRSVYPDSTGFPILSAGSFRTDHSSPFRERWGGWYVTGTHGSLRHMGNVLVADKDHPELLDVESGANVTDLGQHLATGAYLTPHSDIVALMILEHQTYIHNRIARTNYATRTALHNGAIMNEMLGRPADFRSESTERRLTKLAQELVNDLLMAGEAPLESAVEGTSSFTEDFISRGPSDGLGRSLRHLDLKRRLFKYPCSYLVYSEALGALPEPVLERVYRRLWEVLTGRDQSDELAFLSASDRRAILEILRDTKADLPDYFKS